MHATHDHRRITARLAAFVFSGLMLIAGAGATSANTDVTDLWWNPAESGWGMQLNNTGSFAFATVFAYGPDGKPTWFIAEMHAVGVFFSGPLYVATGPYYGGPFNAAATTRNAGIMSFVLTSISTAEIAYTVDGVTVSKSVQRQPLTPDNYEGTYIAGFTQSATGCLDAGNNRTTSGPGSVSVTQVGRSMVVYMTYPSGDSCTLDGTYSQLGRMGQVTGTYACVSGESGAGSIVEMSNVPFMFTARLRLVSSNRGCSTAGEFAAVIPR